MDYFTSLKIKISLRNLIFIKAILKNFLPDGRHQKSKFQNLVPTCVNLPIIIVRGPQANFWAWDVGPICVLSTVTWAPIFYFRPKIKINPPRIPMKPTNEVYRTPTWPTTYNQMADMTVVHRVQLQHGQPTANNGSQIRCLVSSGWEPIKTEWFLRSGSCLSTCLTRGFVEFYSIVI